MAATTLKMADNSFVSACAFPLDLLPRREYRLGQPEAIPAPGPEHQALALKIAAALLRFVETANLGRIFPAPCNVTFSRQIVVQPDIIFIRSNRSGIIGDRHLIGVPDLIIEVLSQAQRGAEYRTKKGIYSRFGVPELWAVHPAHGRIEAFIWSELGYVCSGIFGQSDRLHSHTLPGLDIPLAGIFRN